MSVISFPGHLHHTHHLKDKIYFTKYSWGIKMLNEIQMFPMMIYFRLASETINLEWERDKLTLSITSNGKYFNKLGDLV